MNLEQIKDTFKSVSLSHKAIQDFDFGDDFHLATGKGNDYPLAFLEIPYSTTYDLTNNRFKTHQFAFHVLIDPSFDDAKGDHIRISKAETIGDAILTKIQKEVSEFKFDSISGVSLREFSDDNVSGFRFDLTIRTARACYNIEDFVG